MRCNYKQRLKIRVNKPKDLRLAENEKIAKEKENPSLSALFDGICRIQFYCKGYCLASFCGMASHYKRSENDVLLKKRTFVYLVALIIKGNQTRFERFVHNDDAAMVIGPKTFGHVVKYLRSLDVNDLVKGKEHYKAFVENLYLAQVRGYETKIIFM